MPSFKRLPAILTLLGVLSFSTLLPACAQTPKRGDDTVLEMHQAWRKMDRSRLSALLPQVQGHTLEVVEVGLQQAQQAVERGR